MASKKVSDVKNTPPPVSEVKPAVKKKSVKKVAEAAALPVAAETPVTKTPRRKAAAVKTKAEPVTMAETQPASISNLSEAVQVFWTPERSEVEERAYQSWIERGCPMGSPEEDWYRAERELIARFASSAK